MKAMHRSVPWLVGLTLVAASCTVDQAVDDRSASTALVMTAPDSAELLERLRARIGIGKTTTQPLPTLEAAPDARLLEVVFASDTRARVARPAQIRLPRRADDSVSVEDEQSHLAIR